MRENWARTIAASTGIGIIILAAIFARIQNPEQPRPEPAPDSVTQLTDVDSTVASSKRSPSITAGRNVFLQQKCLGCHSINGEGNTRYPLDGLSEHYTDSAIRQRILADPEIEDQLPAWVIPIKQNYANLPPEELNVLVQFLHHTATAP